VKQTSQQTQNYTRFDKSTNSAYFLHEILPGASPAWPGQTDTATMDVGTPHNDQRSTPLTTKRSSSTLRNRVVSASPLQIPCSYLLQAVLCDRTKFYGSYLSVQILICPEILTDKREGAWWTLVPNCVQSWHYWQMLIGHTRRAFIHASTDWTHAPIHVKLSELQMKWFLTFGSERGSHALFNTSA